MGVITLLETATVSGGGWDCGGIAVEENEEEDGSKTRGRRERDRTM